MLGVILAGGESTRMGKDKATVEVAGMPVRVKLSPGRVKVEHDDAARVAELGRLPLREVMSLAEAEARRQTEPRATPGDSVDDPEPA